MEGEHSIGEKKDFSAGSQVKFRQPDDPGKYRDTDLRYINQTGTVAVDPSRTIYGDHFVQVQFPDGHQATINRQDLLSE